MGRTSRQRPLERRTQLRSPHPAQRDAFDAARLRQTAAREGTVESLTPPHGSAARCPSRTTRLTRQVHLPHTLCMI